MIRDVFRKSLPERSKVSRDNVDYSSNRFRRTKDLLFVGSHRPGKSLTTRIPLSRISNRVTSESEWVVFRVIGVAFPLVITMTDIS